MSQCLGTPDALVLRKECDVSKRIKNLLLRVLIGSAIGIMGTVSCGGEADSKKEEAVALFDPKTCFDELPESLDGLKIIQGPRTVTNIIQDMRTAECNAYELFRQMRNSVREGEIVFRIAVEYTGEVARVDIEKDTVGYERFSRDVSDFIMDSDFSGWVRHDDDTVFLYPMRFSFRMYSDEK